MKTSFRPWLKFGESQVNGRVSRLHCTWLVPRTRASFDDVDGFLTLMVDLLEEACSTLRAWPNRLTQDVPRCTQIPYSAAIDLVAGLGMHDRYLIPLLHVQWIHYRIERVNNWADLYQERIADWNPRVAKNKK
ncbi:hypothetical protein M9H77_06197 [Catharanthus roseus]|uniref:Uncharacterized protein n=1 Tax=Catharanthus roseus TaxID=4058 RepID=A0ACC0BRF2_CATRO|nr:hypothetical protein M9H77_06197 [Catharanthus roseus]